MKAFALPVLLLLVVLGCRNQTQPASSLETSDQQGSGNVQSDPIVSTVRDERKSVAIKAKDLLFAKLSGRLMEVMQTEGPRAAIEVCSSEAIKISEQVGVESGVKIGRTSFKLRNQSNAPKDWVRPFVEQRTDTPQFVDLESGELGAIFPIHLNVKCLMCHGNSDDILDDVQAELAKRYPDDAATGFQQGDLRGWFWVEVPANPE